MKKMLLTLAVCLASSFGFTYAEVINSELTNTQDFGDVKIDYSYQLTKSKDGNIEYIMFNKSRKHQVKVEFYSVEDFSLAQSINFEVSASDKDTIHNVFSLNNEYLFVQFKHNDYSKYDMLKLYDITGKLIYTFGTANNKLTPQLNDDCTCSVYHIADNKLLFIIERVVNYENSYGLGRTRYTREFYHLILPSPETGVQSVQVEKKAAFPCPAREVVNIPTSAERGHLHIRNTNGRVVKSQPVNGAEYQQVNTSNFPAGTYIYQTETESGSFIVK